MLAIEAVLLLLTTPKKIFITTHHKPDGDAIGSTLGLYHYLRQKGHEPVVISPSAVPDFLQWMPGIETVLNFEAEPNDCVEKLKAADLIFCLDFNHLSRVKNLEKALRAASQPRVLIDHHLIPEKEVFQYGISQPEKSSTCEMVYDVILTDKGSDLLNKAVMECLYTGAMTDTGSFRFSATSASVHRMVADFIERGLEHSKIHDQVFDVWSESRLRMLGYLLHEKMLIYPESHIGIIAITLDDLKRYHAIAGDTEGIVNYPMTISGINIAVLLIERGHHQIKLSFRSKGDIDVSAIAREKFNGGGHFNAAGGSSDKDISDTLEDIKQSFNINSPIHS